MQVNIVRINPTNEGARNPHVAKIVALEKKKVGFGGTVTTKQTYYMAMDASDFKEGQDITKDFNLEDYEVSAQETTFEDEKTGEPITRTLKWLRMI